LNYTNVIVLLQCSLVFWGCSSNSGGNLGTTPVVKMNLEQTLEIPTLPLLENSTVVRLQLTEKSSIDLIDKAAISDEKLLVINRNRRSKSVSLLAFTHSGDFLWERSGNAEGPGNFSGYTDFTVGLDGNIEVLDGIKRTILTYDLSGNYLTSNQIYTDAQRFAPLVEGGYATHRNNTYQFGSQVSEYNLEFTDSKGEQTGGAHLFMSPVVRDMKLSGERFFPRKRLGDYFSVNPPSDTIYSVSSLSVTPLFTLDYPARKNKTALISRLEQRPDFKNDRGGYNMAFLEFLNNPEIFSKYDLVTEGNEYYLLSFRRGGTRFFVKVHKESLKSSVYNFDDSLLDQTHVFLLDDDTVAFTYTNPYVMKHWIEARDPQLHDKWFADFREAEPNPVLIVLDLATFNEVGLLPASKK